MHQHRSREEVLNVALAQALSSSGFVSIPESVIVGLSGKRSLPDVLVDFRGLRTVIEGKIGDSAPTKEAVLQQSLQRLDSGVAHLAIAVVYPEELRGVALAEMPTRLRQASLLLNVCDETGQSGWQEGDLEVLTDLLSRSYSQLASDPVVADATKTLDLAVAAFARVLTKSSGAVRRSAEKLGFRDLNSASDDESDE